MWKKMVSVILAAAMALSVSVTAFADSEKTMRAAANNVVRNEESAAKKATKRKVISKSEKKEEQKKGQQDTQKAKKTASKGSNKGVSVLQKTAKLRYGSFDYPQNVTMEKVDRNACDLFLQDKNGENEFLVRLRVFDHETALTEEIIDENGLMYGMYTGFLTIASLNKSAAQISKGIADYQIRREVVSTFNHAMAAQDDSHAESYTENSEMSAIRIAYSDEKSAEECIILHGKDYDYVLFGASTAQKSPALDRVIKIMASTLKEKGKM